MLEKNLAITCLILLSGCSSAIEKKVLPQAQVRSASVNTQLGMAYLQKGDVQRAKLKFLNAIDEAPLVPDAWYSMGYFLEVTGQKEQAKAHYLQAIKLDPTNGVGHNNYGTFLCRAGQYQAGIDQFMLSAQDPRYLQIASAYENAGLCALKIPNHKLAYDYFNKAIINDPHLATSYLELAKLDIATGQYTTARNHLSGFLNVSPPTPAYAAVKSQLPQKG